MSLCCTEIGQLGCFDNCEDIDTGLVALQTGVHTIREYWLDGIHDVEVTITMGNNIIIPNVFNEYADHTIKIFQPDGSVFVSGLNDCFNFTVSGKSS